MLPTRWRKKYIEKQMKTSMCILGGEKEETTFHILCECSKIVATDYIRRHGGVDNIVHWNLTRQYRKKQCWEIKKQIYCGSRAY